VGHQAVLIGNDKDGWTYYSYDKDAGDFGGANDRCTKGVFFASVAEFAGSEHNTFKSDYDDGKGLETSHRSPLYVGNPETGKIIQRYEDGYRIVTDVATDAEMMAAAEGTFMKDYSVPSGNECTTVVRNALDAAGLNNGEHGPEQMVPTRAGMMPHRNPLFLPTAKQAEIERTNEGTDCDDQLEVDDRLKCRDGAGYEKP